MAKLRSTKLQIRPAFSVGKATTVAGAVVLVGLVVVLVSRAAGASIPLEAEIGTLTGGVTVASDSTASGGKAVKFAGMTPVGPSGNWTLAFDDEFNGTSLDTSKWTNTWYGEGGKMNNVGTYSSNLAVTGGNLVLTLASSSSGALVHTDYSAGRYQLAVGDYAEARIYFPGSGTSIYNWPAWWASGPNWPAAGEQDIAEGLGTLTVNYHSPSGAHNQGTIPGTWSNGFHIYGAQRLAKSTNVYWDGTLVKSYSTDDNGGAEDVILNVGSGNTGAYGTASQVKVDYVRAWHPAP